MKILKESKDENSLSYITRKLLMIFVNTYNTIFINNIIEIKNLEKSRKLETE